MGALVWVMIGLALWHFTVYLPDHFWGGIAGAFVGAILGSLLGGLIIHAFSVPGRNDVSITTAVEAVPGTLIGMGIVFALGLREERRNPAVPSPAS